MDSPYDHLLVTALYSDQVTLLEALFTAVANGIRVKTIDGSKGSEALVVIVDCMTLGAATEEGMGFLDEDQRRFNVAMSRAQVGRITVYHKGMIPFTILEARFNDVRRTYGAAVQQGAVNHANVSRGKSEEAAEKKVAMSSRRYGIITFLEATGGTEAQALKFLQTSKGGFHVAIDAYHSEHGSNVPVER